MKRKRHTAEEIIKKLREAAGIIAGGKSVEAAAIGRHVKQVIKRFTVDAEVFA
jgi:hypothetical protein